MKYVILMCAALYGCGGSESPAPAPQVANVQPQQQNIAPKRIVFIGDSITARWPTAAYFRKTVDSGIGGQTSCEMRDRFDDDVIAFAPTTVVIHAGINDLSYLQNPSTQCILDMVVRAQQIGAKVIVGTVLPYEDWPNTRWIKDVTQGDEAIKAFNADLKAAATTYGFALVDYYPLFLKDGRQDANLFIDTVHPSPEGYDLMGKALGPML